MTVGPWREVAEPRADIADGSFDESLFAADLGPGARPNSPSPTGRTPVPPNDTYYHAHVMAKTRITVTVEQDLVTRARSLGVSLSAACERGLAEVTETAVARAELARQVAEFEASGGIYDDRKLAKARRVLAEVDAPHQANRIAG